MVQSGFDPSTLYWGFPGSWDGKASAYNVGDPGSIPGSGRSPGEGNGNPLQDSCLENPMDRGACQATVYGVPKSCTWLSDFTSHYTELGLSGKESTCDAGDTGLIPESGRSPGGGHGNPLPYSCLEHCMDRVAWWATFHGVDKRQTGLKQLSPHYTVLIGAFLFKPQFNCHHLREAIILY